MANTTFRTVVPSKAGGKVMRSGKGAQKALTLSNYASLFKN